MGGFGYDIPISLDEALIVKAQQPKPSLCDRRLHREPQPPTPADCYPQFIQLPLPTVTQAIWRDFLEWTEQTTRPPTASTRAALEYLCQIPTEVTISATRAGASDPYKCGLYFRFSGCAGMAEVMSYLVAHWVHLWYGANQARVEREMLGPHNIRTLPLDYRPGHGETQFAPAGAWGYARYWTGGSEYRTVDDFGEETEHPTMFELDVAATDGNDAEALEVLQQLDARFAALMSDGRCLCQICAPDVDFEPDLELR